MLPEEKAREKIDKQLRNAGWDIVSRDEYVPRSASAVKEALMQGNTESDYLLFVDDKAIAVVEAKREENPLGEEVQQQAEDYACNPQGCGSRIRSRWSTLQMGRKFTSKICCGRIVTMLSFRKCTLLRKCCSLLDRFPNTVRCLVWRSVASAIVNTAQKLSLRSPSNRVQKRALPFWLRVPAKHTLHASPATVC